MVFFASQIFACPIPNAVKGRAIIMGHREQKSVALAFRMADIAIARVHDASVAQKEFLISFPEIDCFRRGSEDGDWCGFCDGGRLRFRCGGRCVAGCSEQAVKVVIIQMPSAIRRIMTDFALRLPLRFSIAISPSE